MSGMRKENKTTAILGEHPMKQDTATELKCKHYLVVPIMNLPYCNYPIDAVKMPNAFKKIMITYNIFFYPQCGGCPMYEGVIS
jgi:hypothetical protein